MIETIIENKSFSVKLWGAEHNNNNRHCVLEPNIVEHKKGPSSYGVV